jgi:hypothetical protein
MKLILSIGCLSKLFAEGERFVGGPVARPFADELRPVTRLSLVSLVVQLVIVIQAMVVLEIAVLGLAFVAHFVRIIMLHEPGAD